jgi:IS5 family transposase
MTRWRQRLGEAGAEPMLRANIESGIVMGAIHPAQLKRIIVDMTVGTGVQNAAPCDNLNSQRY